MMNSPVNPYSLSPCTVGGKEREVGGEGGRCLLRAHFTSHSGALIFLAINSLGISKLSLFYPWYLMSDLSPGPYLNS